MLLSMLTSANLQSFVDWFVEFDQVLAQRKLIRTNVIHEVLI